jgi:hypothetical protein
METNCFVWRDFMRLSLIGYEQNIKKMLNKRWEVKSKKVKGKRQK